MGARHFGVGEEGAWGTVTDADIYFEALSETVQLETNFESVETLRGFSPTTLVPLSNIVRGDVEVLCTYDNIGILYKHLIGSAETIDSLDGTYYNWTFPDSSGIPSTDRIGLGLTLEFRRDGGLAWQYPGGKLTSLSQTFSTDQSSRLRIGFLAKEEQVTSGWSTDATYGLLTPIFPAHVNLKYDAGTLNCRSVTINVENPLDETFLLGSTSLAAEPDRNAVLRVTGTAEVLFANLTEYNKFAGNTLTDIQVIAANNTYEFVYNMNSCMLTQATPHNTGRERLAATYEWESVYYDAETENLQVGIINQNSDLLVVAS